MGNTRFRVIDRTKPKAKRNRTNSGWNQQAKTGRFRPCARCARTFEITSTRVMLCHLCYKTAGVDNDDTAA